MAEDDFQIQDPDNYSNIQKEQSYSHSLLVMKALKECLTNRQKEMKDGYMNTKFDKFGNAHNVWVEDSREVFISSVEGLQMIQERDYDDDVIAEIKEIKEKLQEKFKGYCELEEQWWNKLHFKRKDELHIKGSYFVKGQLCNDTPFKSFYIRDKVEAYQKIVSAIQKSIKRIGDYQEELYEA